jgi:PAS domain S-box-containing protein
MDKLTQLERKETALWRVVLLFVVLLAIGLALNSWEVIRMLPERAFRDLAAVPASVVVLVVLFAAYVWHKKREIAELRGFVRGMQQRGESPPTEQQLERLLDVVARSQQGYRDLIDSFDDLVFTLSLDGEVRAANRSFSEVVGVPFPEFIGYKLDEFIEEPTREEALKALERFRDRRNWAGVVRTKFRKTGGVRYYDCVLQAVVRDGQVTGLSCLARDVTNQREAEQRFTELFETLQEGIYFTTPEGEILDANPALVRMLGFERKEDLLRVNVRDLFADPGARARQADELARRGTLLENEIELRRKDGAIISCLDTSSAIRDSAGRVVRYQGSLVDITDRRRIEKKLHEEQEFARRLVDNFPDLIVVVDTRGCYRFVSPSIKELLGYTPEELQGRKVGERSHPEDMAAMHELTGRVLAGQQDFGTIEYRTQHKDGTWRIFRAAVSPLHDAEGKITGLIASSRDFTDLKRLEQQVIQSEKMAAVGQLIAGVAHELNNPMTAILGISDLLRERAANPELRRQVELVSQQARRAADIVGNLLAFSRPAVAQKIPVNLNELLRRTLQLHEYSLRVNNVAVDFMPQDGLPAVQGDPNQLMQVFLNLIVNAEQAIRGERTSGLLRVRAGKGTGANGPTVWATVQDDGPGMPAEVLPRIFDPFFSTKRPGRGTGLGLSICMALVKEHGGSIEAVNAPYGGALFTITLPAVERAAVKLPEPDDSGRFATSAVHPAVAAANVRHAPGPVGLEGRTVLVVDDEESIRELIEAGLSTRGMNVLCAASGEEALRLVDAARAAQQPFDAILCDVKMPGLSGDQLFERLAAGPAATSGAFQQRFIFMTGDLVDQATTSVVRDSGVRCVQKPFRVTDLIAALRETFSS